MRKAPTGRPAELLSLSIRPNLRPISAKVKWRQAAGGRGQRSRNAPSLPSTSGLWRCFAPVLVRSRSRGTGGPPRAPPTRRRAAPAGPGRPGGRHEHEAGVGDPGYGMGLCAGDYDAGGRLDFFLTNYGPDRLFRNLGEGSDGRVRFEEVSERAGVAGDRWGTNCAFADLDGDGDLDLYVANYVDFQFDNNPRCGDPARGIGSYCRPAFFDGQGDYLYVNQGGSGRSVTFVEEGELRGIAQGPDEKGYGVILSDLDGDGDPDILRHYFSIP